MTKKVTAIIVEDEELARDIIKNYLKDFSRIELLGEYPDGYSGVQAINKMKPDLILLDIKVPRISGIEIVELLDYKPEVVFVTAYDEYAIKAFEMNAVDYLMKPFSRDRFALAVKRVLSRIDQGDTGSVSSYTAMRHANGEYLKRIVVKSKSNIHVIKLEELIYLEAMDDYVMIYTEGQRYMKQRSLKYYEEHLNPSDFVRVHRSYIIRISQISRLEQYEKESYKLTLVNNSQVPVSKSGYKRLKEVLRF
ncbi:MAG: LytTR family DNA-binding domain-containing protein [Bacteroidales bacterium]|nr:LytTR family DNA-binding domain-containing protein [Bacteroidales bacterium]